MSPLRINLITNFSDRKGLWRDGCLLEALLSAWGHVLVRVQFSEAYLAEKMRATSADLNIFLETIRPELFPLARQNWFVPNLEWVTEADLTYLPAFDRVLCKTLEAERALTPLTGRAVYTGWESEDRYDPAVPREAKVLHVAGGSILKGTQAVLDAWEQYTMPYPLTVVGDEQVVKPRPIANVTYRGWVDDAQLQRLQNAHRIHLQPSETEGWGHTIHEGLSCGAAVLTTPQIDGTWPLEAHAPTSRNLATLYRVSAETLAATLAAWDMTRHDAGHCRAQFLANRAAFRERLFTLLGRLA